MKLTACIHAKYNEFEKKYEFTVWSMPMDFGGMGYVLVEEQELEFDAPPHEVLVKGTIEQYRAKQKQVKAEAERMHNELQQRINDLLCLEYKPEESTT